MCGGDGRTGHMAKNENQRDLKLLDCEFQTPEGRRGFAHVSALADHKKRAEQFIKDDLGRNAGIGTSENGRKRTLSQCILSPHRLEVCGGHRVPCSGGKAQVAKPVRTLKKTKAVMPC